LSAPPAHIAANAFNKLVSKLFVDRCSIDEGLTSSMVSDEDLLRHSPVAYIIRKDEDVFVKAIGLHVIPSNAWGIAWRYCGTPRCARPKDIVSIDVGQDKIRLRCLRCEWESKALAATDVGWLEQWSSAYPKVYTWTHPLSPDNWMAFVQSETMDVD